MPRLARGNTCYGDVLRATCYVRRATCDVRRATCDVRRTTKTALLLIQTFLLDCARVLSKIVKPLQTP